MKLVPTVKYAELPQILTSLVHEDQLIEAYSSGNSIILWLKTDQKLLQREVEFSLLENRFLTNGEREAKFPPSEEIEFASANWRIVTGFCLDPQTDVMCETYSVFDLQTGDHIAEANQLAVALWRLPVEDVVRPEVEKAQFARDFPSQPLDERVDYFVRTAYRSRHQAGETGDPDDFFTADLVERMCQLDPDAQAILPLVLSGLAAMEGVPPEQMFKNFNLRTGRRIGEP